MIKIGDIVEYQYRGEKNYCWVEWFDLGIERARKSFLKVLTQ
jgi:hypothetical protein